MATACQGDETPASVQRELKEATKQLHQARTNVENLKRSQSGLRRELMESIDKSADLQTLLRKVAASRTPDSCPIHRVPHNSPQVPSVAYAYGEGPAFVGLGTEDSIVLYTVDTLRNDNWYYYKTLWAFSPTYSGKIVITGEQIDGPNILRFNAGSGIHGRKQLKLTVPETTSREWRYAPGDTLIRAPGCYAFHVRGEGFEQRIVFTAVG